jgi:hypothetical protein
MADLIRGESYPEAWLGAMELMAEGDGKGVNLAVAFPGSDEGNAQLEAELDDFLAEKDVKHGIETVANTIFPAALYHPHLGTDAAPRLYENFEMSMRIHTRTGGEKETYFNRLVAYPVADGTADDLDKRLRKDGRFNQLQFFVERLAKQVKQGHSSSSYELGVSHPMDGELRVQAPFTDKSMWSFPCLSHISLTLVDGAVHMCATYRNQTFITRAYGNYVGLARLLRFIANESSIEAGEVMVTASHADAEFGLGKVAVKDLIERCAKIIRPGILEEKVALDV